MRERTAETAVRESFWKFTFNARWEGHMKKTVKFFTGLLFVGLLATGLSVEHTTWQAQTITTDSMTISPRGA